MKHEKQIFIIIWNFFVFLLAFCLVWKWQAGNDYVKNKVVRCKSGSHQKIEAHDFMQLMACEACDGQVPAVLYDLFIQSCATRLTKSP
jgi:hypothetical protein